MHTAGASDPWELLATGAYLPRVGDRVELLDERGGDGRAPEVRSGTVVEVLHFDLNGDIEDLNDTIVAMGARVIVREDDDGATIEPARADEGGVHRE
jgi:hypothetical protein